VKFILDGEVFFSTTLERGATYFENAYKKAIVVLLSYSITNT